MEKNKDSDKSDLQNAQKEALESLKPEARTSSTVAIQHSPAGIYQKNNYVSIFLSIEKKL